MTLARWGPATACRPPKLGDAIVLGIPVPEPNDPEQRRLQHEHDTSSDCWECAREGIACEVRCRGTSLRCALDAQRR